MLFQECLQWIGRGGGIGTYCKAKASGSPALRKVPGPELLGLVALFGAIDATDPLTRLKTGPRPPRPQRSVAKHRPRLHSLGRHSPFTGNRWTEARPRPTIPAFRTAGSVSPWIVRRPELTTRSVVPSACAPIPCSSVLTSATSCRLRPRLGWPTFRANSCVPGRQPEP